jgi:hypothetical protein
MASLYTFGTNRIEVTIYNSSSVILMPIHCCGNVPSEPLPSNGDLCIVSLNADFRRSGVKSQY